MYSKMVYKVNLTDSMHGENVLDIVYHNTLSITLLMGFVLSSINIRRILVANILPMFLAILALNLEKAFYNISFLWPRKVLNIMGFWDAHCHSENVVSGILSFAKMANMTEHLLSSFLLLIWHPQAYFKKSNQFTIKLVLYVNMCHDISKSHHKL